MVGDPVLLDVGGPGGHVLHHLQAIFTLVVISSLQYSVLSRRSLIVTDFTIFRYGSSCNSLYFDLATLFFKYFLLTSPNQDGRPGKRYERKEERMEPKRR